MRLFKRGFRSPEGTSLRMLPYRAGSAALSPINLARIAGVSPLTAARYSRAYLLENSGHLKKLNAGREIRKQPFAKRVFERLAEITKIPEEELLPLQFESSVETGYSPVVHASCVENSYTGTGRIYALQHENLHGAQLPMALNFRQIWDYNKYAELAAEYGSGDFSKRPVTQAFAVFSTLSSTVLTWGSVVGKFSAGLAALNAAGVGVEYSRMHALKKAIQRHGVDGWIALHSLGSFEPMFSQGYLGVLEKKGYLHRGETGKKGFTKKGKEWISYKAPQMRAFLEQARKQREKMQCADK